MVRLCGLTGLTTSSTVKYDNILCMYKQPDLVNQCVQYYVTGYGKRAHFAQELIFQNKQFKNVTPLDFVHNSDSLKCYNFSQEDQFLCFKVHLKAQNEMFLIKQ